MSEHLERAETGLASRAMRPVRLRRSIGWFHDAPARNVPGVVLCPALGREARWSYRTMRLLAAQLAARGIPALRFEYPGTGDALDWLDDEDALAAWRDGLHEAIDWLQGQTELGAVSLCGLRFGALLAADAASRRTDIAALALLSPILAGKNAARELRLASFGGEGDEGPANGIEVDGMILPDATLAAMATLDLRKMAAPVTDVLLLDPQGMSGKVAEQWRADGAAVSVAEFAGYADLMRPATSNVVPRQALDTVSAWFADLSTPEPPRRMRPPHLAPVLAQPRFLEEAVQFGPDGRLAGTLCLPASAACLAVLIPNTGGDGRAGIARFGARLARGLAGLGIASLRFDFGGLGDSALPGEADCHLYQTDRALDVTAALDMLQMRGFARFAGVGACTGGYHLLRSAFREDRLEHVALVNLVTMDWQDGDVIEVPQRALALAPQAIHPRAVLPGDEVSTEVLRLARDRSVTLVYGEADPGLLELRERFGPEGSALRAAGARITVLPGLDHTLSRRQMQDRVITLLARTLLATTVHRATA